LEKQASQLAEEIKELTGEEWTRIGWFNTSGLAVSWRLGYVFKPGAAGLSLVSSNAHKTK